LKVRIFEEKNEYNEEVKNARTVSSFLKDMKGKEK
jgi:hypothetical protein